MVNNVCDCGKRTEYLRERLDNPTDIETGSDLEIDSVMEDSFT